VGDDIIEMNVLVAPLEVVDYSFVGQLLLNNENVLEEVNKPLVDVEVVELSNHSLLILEVSFVRVNQGVALVNDGTDIVKNLGVSLSLQLSQGVVYSLIFPLFPFQLEVHVFNLFVVAFKFPKDHLLVLAVRKFDFNVFKVIDYLG